MTDLEVGILLASIFILAPVWVGILHYLWDLQEKIINKLKG